MAGLIRIADRIDEYREPECFHVSQRGVDPVRLIDLLNVGDIFVFMNSGGGSVRMLRRINLMLQLISRRAEIFGYCLDSVGSAAASIAVKIAEVGTLYAYPQTRFMLHAAAREEADVAHPFGLVDLQDLDEHMKELWRLHGCFDNPDAAREFESIIRAAGSTRLEVRPSSNLLYAGDVLAQVSDRTALLEVLERDSNGVLHRDLHVVRDFV